MKSIAFFLVLLVHSAHLCAEDIKVYALGWSTPSANGDSLWQVPREELEKTRAWNPSNGQRAPLLREQAVTIARKAAAAQDPSLSDDPRIVVSLEKIEPSYLLNIQKHPIRGCQWFYLVKFPGKKEHMHGDHTFLVTMSGAIATREIRQVR